MPGELYARAYVEEEFILSQGSEDGAVQLADYLDALGHCSADGQPVDQLIGSILDELVSGLPVKLKSAYGLHRLDWQKELDASVNEAARRRPCGVVELELRIS